MFAGVTGIYRPVTVGIGSQETRWTATLLVPVALFTPDKVIPIVCPLEMFVRCSVTVLPSGLIIGDPDMVPDMPACGVIVAPLNVTALGKVNTTS